MPGLPGTVPGVPGTPGQTPGTEPGTEPGSSGQPDGQSEDGTGSGGQPTWETAPQEGGAAGQSAEPAGSPGSAGQGGMPGGTPGDDSTAQGSGGSGGNGDEESWEAGLPGGTEGDGNGGWATSNQVPGVNSMPPMPTERDLPPGSGGDSELDKALQDFDGEILAEREVIQARANETAANSGTPSSLPGGSSGGGVSGGEPASGNASSDTQTAFPGNQGPRGRSAPPAPTSQANVPADLPDARDDDIIARQLREAAMNETDPELQEKLWEEYRRYKNG